MSRTDETESVLREAFMWGTLVSPLAASRIAARAGAESLFGFGVLGAGVVALLVPAAWLSPYHVALRIVQGMCMVKMLLIILGLEIFIPQYTNITSVTCL